MERVLPMYEEDLADLRMTIQAALDPKEQVRDIFDERYGRLSSADAKKLIEESVREYLFESSEDLKEEIFKYSFLESYDENEYDENEVNWNRVYNDYLELLTIVTAVRSSDPKKTKIWKTSFFDQVASSVKPSSEAVKVFEENPNISPESGRAVIEACYQTLLSTIDDQACRLIFDYSYSRESQSGWLAVSREYEKVANLVSLAKIPVFKRRELTEALENLQKERSARNKRLLG